MPSMACKLLPELPITHDLIWPEFAGHCSVNVDYALFAKDRSKVYFVELKTDARSGRDTQDHYLETASARLSQDRRRLPRDLAEDERASEVSPPRVGVGAPGVPDHAGRP